MIQSSYLSLLRRHPHHSPPTQPNMTPNTSSPADHGNTVGGLRSRWWTRRECGRGVGLATGISWWGRSQWRLRGEGERRGRGEGGGGGGMKHNVSGVVSNVIVPTLSALHTHTPSPSSSSTVPPANFINPININPIIIPCRLDPSPIPIPIHHIPRQTTREQKSLPQDPGNQDRGCM